jgi:predicted transposase/invertase (TIGR01784 family)
MKTDSLFYQFFKSFPEAFFQLINERKRTDYQFASVEIKDTRFILDGIFTPVNHKETLYFTEFQFQRKAIYPRFFAEIFLYLYRHKIESDWKAVIIFPSKKTDIGPGKPYKHFLITNKIKIIYLDELPKRILKKFPLNILKLIISDKEEFKVSVKNLITSIESKVTKKEEKDKINELILKIIFSKLPELTLEEIDKMLIAKTLDIKKSRAARQLIREGMSKGKTKGRLEGRLEIARAMVKKGMRKEEITELTGLTEKEVIKLTTD